MGKPECALIIENAIIRRIKKVVKEYMERMFNSFKTLHGASTDEFIECPKCGSWQGLQWYEYGQKVVWRCLTQNCSFILPDEFAPPNPPQLLEFYKRRELETKIKKFISEEEIKKFL